jgi:hypothetical protein
LIFAPIPLVFPAVPPVLAPIRPVFVAVPAIPALGHRSRRLEDDE